MTIFLAKYADPNVVEVMCNPNEDDKSTSVYWEINGEKEYDEVLSKKFTPSVVDAIIKTIAGYYDKTVNETNPVIECQFPIDGSRFTGIFPPGTTAPSSTIRKRPAKILTLDEYIENKIMTLEQQSQSNKPNQSR